MQEWNFYIVTLGCKVNQYESQAVREAWQALGGKEVEKPAQAHIALVNSCAITANAERDTRAALYKLEREAPQAKRLLTGCAATLLQKNPPRKGLFHALIPMQQKASLLQDPRHLPELASSPCAALSPFDAERSAPPLPPTQQISTAATAANATTYPPFSIAGFKRARPVLKVQDGCTHRCTYCIVPTMRSQATSRPPHEVLAEARRLFRAGYREIMISGINLLLYGRDTTPLAQARHGEPFWNLLRLLEKELAPEWAGRARLRISSLEPRQLNDYGIETLAQSSLLCPHLHISLQSGSTAVLRRMGRGHYKAQDLVTALGQLAQHWQHFGLGADILMGFPGETEEHVAQTLELVQSLPFSYAHVFPYSRRPGTAAASFPQQVEKHEKAARAARVREAIAAKQQEHWQAMLALPSMLVAIDSPEQHKAGSLFKGINAQYTPCLLHELPTMPNPHSLLLARPLHLCEHGIVVQSLGIAE
jgi:threonylcarbamoyladenosine tRNA methylthiotransferase MtaB